MLTYKFTLVDRSALSEPKTRARIHTKVLCVRFTKTSALLCHLFTLRYSIMELHELYKQRLTV